MASDLLVEILSDVTNTVSDLTLSKIKQAEYAANASAVHYMYGSDEEIVARLSQLSKGNPLDKYPLIWLMTPFDQFQSLSKQYDDLVFDVLVINGTKADLISPQRYDKNFIPILKPIADEFLNQLQKFTYGRYKPFEAGEMENGYRFNDYWGKKKAQNSDGKSANVLLDFLDCIELRNIKIKLEKKYC